MKYGKWDNVVEFMGFVDQMRSQEERFWEFKDELKAMFPVWKRDRQILMQCLADGFGDSFIKALFAELEGIASYDPVDMAENVGRDPSRIRKPFNDRSLQEVLQFAYLLTICRVHGIHPKEILRLPSKKLATTAGICRAVVKLHKRWFPDWPIRKLSSDVLPIVSNDILPIQAGLLLNELMVWPDLQALVEHDWSADSLMLRNGSYERRFLELIDRANQPIHDSGLSSAVDPISLSNLEEWLAVAKQFCWPTYFFVSELLPVEISDDAGLPFPLVGIWNEFEDSGCDEYYWNIPV